MTIATRQNVYQWALKQGDTTLYGSSPRRRAAETVMVLPTAAAIAPEILDVKLKPNPVNTDLAVSVTGSISGKASLTLYNLQGQRVRQLEFVKPSAHTVTRIISVSGLPPGSYAIQLVIGNKAKVVQFIKQ